MVDAVDRAEPVPATSAAMAKLIRAEQIRRLYRQAPGSYLGTLGTCCVAVLFLSGEVPANRLVPWLAFGLPFTVSWFYLPYRYRRTAHDQHFPHDLPCFRVARWRRRDRAAVDGLFSQQHYGRSMFVLFAVVMWFMAIVYLFGRHDQNELPGTGIDLANVRRIIERHGGVWARAEKGAGAAFYLSFPLKGA